MERIQYQLLSYFPEATAASGLVPYSRFSHGCCTTVVTSLDRIRGRKQWEEEEKKKQEHITHPECVGAVGARSQSREEANVYSSL